MIILRKLQLFMACIQTVVSGLALSAWHAIIVFGPHGVATRRTHTGPQHRTPQSAGWHGQSCAHSCRGVRKGAEPEFAALDRMIHVGRHVLRIFFDMHSLLFICQIQVFRDTLTVLLQNFLIHLRITFSGIFFSTPQECSLVICLFNNTSHLSLFSIVRCHYLYSLRQRKKERKKKERSWHDWLQCDD